MSTAQLSNTPNSDFVIDDSNLDQIHYIPATDVSTVAKPVDGNWTHSSVDFRYYKTTYSDCDVIGCSIVFPFTGTRVAVFGSILNSTNVISLYSIDGGGTTPFASNPTSRTAFYGVEFYRSSDMPLAEHTLVINVTGASEAGPYLLDWIEYNATMPSSTSSSVATESASGAPASGQSQGGKVPVGGIVGGAGGALILMLGCILGLLLWRRRRDAKKARELNAGYYNAIPFDASTVEPSSWGSACHPCGADASGDPKTPASMTETQPQPRISQMSSAPTVTISSAISSSDGGPMEVARSSITTDAQAQQYSEKSGRYPSVGGTSSLTYPGSTSVGDGQQDASEALPVYVP